MICSLSSTEHMANQDDVEQGLDVVENHPQPPLVVNIEDLLLQHRRNAITTEHDFIRTQWQQRVIGIAAKYFSLTLGSIIVFCAIFHYGNLSNLLLAAIFTGVLGLVVMVVAKNVRVCFEAFFRNGVVR